MHERELAEAKDDLNRAMKQRVKAIEQCARIKELSRNSASDLELQDRFEDGRVASDLEQQRAESGDRAGKIEAVCPQDVQEAPAHDGAEVGD